MPPAITDAQWLDLQRLLASELSAAARGAVNEARQLYAYQTYFSRLNRTHRAALHRDTGLVKKFRTQLRELLVTWHDARQDEGARKLLDEMSDNIQGLSRGKINLDDVMARLITANMLIKVHADEVRHRTPKNPRCAFIRSVAGALEAEGLKISARGDVDAYDRASPFVYAIKLLLEQLDERLGVTDGPQALTTWSSVVASELGIRRQAMVKTPSERNG